MKNKLIQFTAAPQAGTWDSARFWLTTSKSMEQGKVFCQVMIGFDLLALKKTQGIEHGTNRFTADEKTSQIGKSTWVETLESELKLPHTTAYRFMEMASAASPKLKKFAEASTLPLLEKPLTDFSAKEREALEAVVHKVADGKTQTEFSQWAGITKKPPGNPNLGGNHGGDYAAAAAKRNEQLPLDEQLKIARKVACEDLGFACHRLEEGAWMVLDDSQVEAVLGTIEAVAKGMRKWVGLPQKQRPAHRDEILDAMKPKA